MGWKSLHQKYKFIVESKLNFQKNYPIFTKMKINHHIKKKGEQLCRIIRTEFLIWARSGLAETDFMSANYTMCQCQYTYYIN